MTRRRSLDPIPSLPRLTARLNAALGTRHDGHQTVSVVERHAEVSQSTFASEVVTCQIEDRRLRLFCKYSKPQGDSAGHRAYGLRRGIAFEADVYEHVLRPLGVSVPALHGLYRHAGAPETWLLLEYVDHAVPVNKDPACMPEAAAWIGRFHALNEHRLDSPALVFLRRFDAAYYRAWARRTLRFAQRFQLGGRWLTKVCEGFGEFAHELLAAPQTVIHGEYYPANVLAQHRRIRPVDWETAAVACGEMDIASLTDSWPRRVSLECERAYREARWPRGAPRGFGRRLQAARFYTALRWAGEPSGWITESDREYHVERLRATGERLGLY